jgi:hypothetical protein
MSETTGLPVFRNMLPGLLHAPARFPVPLSCAAAWAAVTIARSHGIVGLAWEIVERWQVLFIGGLFLSLAATLFAEGRQWGWLRSLGLAFAAFALAAVVVYVDESPDAWESPGFYLLVPGAILLMIVAPFLRRGADDRAVWDFNLASWLSVLFGLIVAVALGLGLTALLGGLETLFGFNIRDKIYEDAWIVCMSLIWPWQTLAGIPGQRHERADTAPPRWTAYVVSWLLIPLALIYLLLLYGFAAKVLATWELPRGTVGWLVGGFAGFGLAVWSAAWPFRETGNRLVRLYHHFFHYALVVPVILLAIGVSVRIAEYGVTEKRYALMLLTLWLGGIALYGIMARPARLAVAPATFAALLIAGAIGPWGATSVSIRSQLSQLDALLAEAGVLQDGKLSKPAETVGSDLVKRISSVVDYLNRPGKTRALSEHLKDSGIELAASANSADIVATLGMEYLNRWGRPDEQPWRWSRSDPAVMAVSGFETAVRIDLGSGGRQARYAEIDGSRTSVDFANSGGALRISFDGRNLITIDLAPLVETLRHDGIPGYDITVNAPLMVVEARGGGLKARVYFTSIVAEGPAEALKISNLSFIALLGTDES